MKKRMLSILMALAMILSLLPVTVLAAPVGGTVERVKDTATWYPDATKEFMTRSTYWNDQVTSAPAEYSVDESAKTVSIGSPEALVWWAKQVNAGTSFAGYTVNITADLNLSAHYWTPICTGTVSYSGDGKYAIANNMTLDGTTIDGNGHTITGLATQTGVRGPNQDSKPGDGQNCYYDAAFIGYSCCNITVEDLTFDGARIAISEPFDEVVNTYGSSMLAVVVGAQTGGSLTLKKVTVNDADVLAMQKASAFVGNLMGNSTLTVDQCAITNSRFSAYFMVAPIASYGTVAQVTVNGIKLENNQIRMVDQTWATYTQDKETGAWYCDGDLNACSTALFYNGSSAVGTGTVWAPVAEVNGYQYDTLSAAINAVQDGQTVKLQKDFTENNLPNVTKTITLDLNGHTLTTNKLISQGNLTIVDSTVMAEPVVSSDYGTVTYESGKIKVTDTAVYAAFGGTVTLKSGTIESSNLGAYAQGNTTGAEEISSTFNVEGGYIIAQEFAATTQGKGATLNISGGVLVAKDNAVVAGNGTKTAEKDMGGTAINISGGTMIGHIISNGYIACGVYHPQQGKLMISGGTIYADGGVGVLMRAGSASITGGTITATGTSSGKVGDSRIIQNCYGVIYDEESNYPGMTDGDKVVISGDAQIAADPAASALYVWKSADTPNRIVVEGGYFTSDPSAYVADGKAALPSDNGAYAFMVGAAAQTDVEPAVGAPDVTMGNQIAAEDQDTVKDAAASVTTSGELAAAANQAIGQVTEQQKIDAEAAIKADNSGVTVGEDNTVTIYAQTYLDITPTGYDKTQGQQSLTLDITPMYRVVASTADNAAAIKLEGNGKNAVVLEGSEKELTGIKNMTISITLPTDFPTDNLYVKHTKDGAFVGYHKTTVSDTTLTFTNDKGFSTFEIMADSRTATVKFGGETGQITYTPANVGDALPTAAAPDGQEFGGWTFKDIEGTYTTLTDDLLTALNGKTVNATAYFYTPSTGSTTYAITVSKADNGTVTASRTSASKNLTITLTVKANEGYKLDTLTVTDKNGSEVKLTDKGDGKYTFAMPASAVTVKATFVKDETPVETGLPFTDVKDGDWFYNAVKYVYDNKLMDGTSSTTFAPLMTTNRAMVVTILWRQAGSPVVNYAMNFGDVESSVWYTEAVRWAASEGIVKGYSDTVFAPDDTVTREQLATILYRYAEKKGYDVSAKGDLSVFTDGTAVSSWAADGTVWAVGAQLLSGKDGGKLDPTGTATRSEVATILMRFCENVAK